MLGQYLASYPIDYINRFIELNKQGENPEIDLMLCYFNIFQNQDLNNLVEEFYSIIDPSYYSKDINNMSMIKLEEVIMTIGTKGQIIFHYQFRYVVYIRKIE